MGALRFFIRTLVFLLVVLTGASFFLQTLKTIALASPFFNALILGVLLFGISYAIFQFVTLIKEGRRLESYQQVGGLNGASRRDDLSKSTLLSPVATLLQQHKYLAPPHVRFVLDTITGRLDEGCELLRYVMGLLIFLGLLGTFWGLSQTIGAITQVITDLPTEKASLEVFFELLKLNLKKPLSGMGTAFSTSLFGLSGSLILGFVELQVGRAQQDFVRSLEEWLTQLMAPKRSPQPEAFEGEGSALSSSYVEAFWHHIGEHLETLQKTLLQSEKGQGELHKNLMVLTEKMSKLTEQMRTEQTLMVRLAEGQIQFEQSIKELSQNLLSQNEESRAYLRSIDLGCKQLLQEIFSGRKENLQEIRQEIRLLGRALTTPPPPASPSSFSQKKNTA